METNKDLTRIRKNIDDIDSMIITLLAKRADLVTAAAKLKKDAQSVRDPKRTEQVIQKVKERAAEKRARSVDCGGDLQDRYSLFRE